MARCWLTLSMPFAYLFLACVLCYCCSFFVLFSCSCWSFVDVPLIFSCPADNVQYRIGNHVCHWDWLEARSVNVKNTPMMSI